MQLYTGLSSLAGPLYGGLSDWRVGQEIRTKQGWVVPGLPLPLDQDREETDWPEEPGATSFQCPTCSVAHQESWASLCLLLRVVQ